MSNSTPDSITEQIGAYSVTTSKSQIAREAIQAALAGTSINDACRYPFGGPRAEHFKLVYHLCRPLARDAANSAAQKRGQP